MSHTASSSMDESAVPKTPVCSASPEPSALNNTVRLQVGERWFTTTRGTLVSRSKFFDALLSSRWNTPREDGSYFIDSDPALFEHVLRYLRRPNVLPIFYDPVKGHDIVLCNSLLEEARYFGIDELVDWFGEQGYLKELAVEHTVTEIRGKSRFSNAVRGVQQEDICEVKQKSNTHVTFQPVFIPRKVYVCPRNIWVHRGRPSKCGNDCKMAQGSRPNMYEHEVERRVVIIKTKTTVRSDLDADRVEFPVKVEVGSHGPSLI